MPPFGGGGGVGNGFWERWGGEVMTMNIKTLGEKENMAFVQEGSLALPAALYLLRTGNFFFFFGFWVGMERGGGELGEVVGIVLWLCPLKGFSDQNNMMSCWGGR